MSMKISGPELAGPGPAAEAMQTHPERRAWDPRRSQRVRPAACTAHAWPRAELQDRTGRVCGLCSPSQGILLYSPEPADRHLASPS